MTKFTFPEGAVVDAGGGLVQVTLPGSGPLVSASAYASPPADPQEGQLWVPSDGYHDFLRYDGALWRPHLRGVAGKLPVDTGFSWVNQDSSTLDTSGPAHVLRTVAGDNAGVHLRVKTAPTPPYTITAAMLSVPTGNGYPGFGLAHRESSSGKMYFIQFFTSASSDQQTLRVDYWTDPDTFSSGPGGPVQFPVVPTPVWLRIADDNTNRKYSWSADGRNFVQLYSVARTTNMTANQVGWLSRPHASYDNVTTLLSWVES